MPMPLYIPDSHFLQYDFEPFSTQLHIANRKGGDVSDENGQAIQNQVLDVLTNGDIVRVFLHEPKSRTLRAPYLQIVKMEGDTYWGEVLDICQCESFVDSVLVGEILPFKAENVFEVPISWQSQSQQLKMEPLLLVRKEQSKRHHRAAMYIL